MKKIICVLLALLIPLAFAGCGGGETPAAEGEAPKSALEMADSLMKSLTFEDDMALNEFPMDTLSRYDVEESDVEDVAWYVGSGAVADEFAVIRCRDENALNSVKTAIDGRIEYLHDGYSDYAPAQVPRIDNAKVLTYGNTLVYCICTDSDSLPALADALLSK